MSINPDANPSRASRHRSRSARGFTLIEVIIALTLFALITGTLFAIIQGAVKGSSEIEQVRRENDSINRLLDVCRKTFATLPSAATLTLETSGSSMTQTQELRITGSPDCFGFGATPISYSETTLGLQPDPSGHTDANGALIQSFSLSREDLIPATPDNEMALAQDLGGALATDAQGRRWMPLLQDVVSMKWRCYKLDEDVWYEEWTETNWPNLIELQLVMKDRLTPIRMVFALPVTTLTPGSGSSGSSSSAPTTSTTPSPSAPSPSAGPAPSGGPTNSGGGGR
ncbi:MAG: prepilin-type N-terminal cleavage/methylation domain-containing protein [Verrucomicrobiales bacterium]|nr:prepilin-type N-terminal cleavage/methylation domain-containing protein [Verrucomicrobiales bacterium]